MTIPPKELPTPVYCFDVSRDGKLLVSDGDFNPSHPMPLPAIGDSFSLSPGEAPFFSVVGCTAFAEHAVLDVNPRPNIEAGCRLYFDGR